MQQTLARVLFLIFVSSPGLVHSAASKESSKLSPCPSVVFAQAIEPELNDAELRWVCGDSQSLAYQDIPLYQAAFHLRAFLDSRGYVRAEFEIKDGVLRVEAGEAVRVSSVDIAPPDPELLKIAERFKGQVLRPSLLNSIETAVQRELLETGHSCAVVTSQAWDSNVVVRATPGPVQSFASLRADPIESLRPEALIRFRPFNESTPYDVRLLELHEKRLLRENVVQGTYYRENCTNPQTLIEQSFLLGPPRTLRFGIGIDTENGPMLQASWRHHRFSRMASQASFTLQASISQQSLVGLLELYPWPGMPRTAITPQFKLTRSVTDDVVEITASLEAPPSRTWDSRTAEWTLSAGPAVISNWYQTTALSSFRQDTSLALIARAEFRTHSFEIFDAHPQDGTLVGLSLEHRDPVLGFFDRTSKVALDARGMIPMGYCGKGRCIGAIRGSLSSTRTSKNDLAALPPSLKTYLGGFDSLRGFGLKDIPDNDGVGALSSATLGFELRAWDTFVPKWEPYVFYDLGAVGFSPMSFDSKIYSAPGIGLRWVSPIGMVQGYIARPSTGGFYYYAAFGGEF